MKTVAVVDDNPDNSLLIEAFLEDTYIVITYSNGIDALKDFEFTKMDILLLDISLPFMDGIEVLKQFRRMDNLKHIPVIALTANAMKGDEQKYLEHGFDDYLAKPIVDEKVLLQKIEKLMKDS